jgi:large subunit ribosomal protein L10
VLRAQGLFVYIITFLILVLPEVRTMATETKVKIVASLQEALSRCRLGVLTDYRGLTTAELNELRRKLRESGIEYRVVKNSLAQIAARQAGMDTLAGSFEGPVAVAFDYSESLAAAKVLADYIRTNKSILNVKGGFLRERMLNPAEVDTLAKLPPKQVLISQVMAGIQSPIYGLVNVLAAPIRGMIQVLQQRIQQMEGK